MLSINRCKFPLQPEVWSKCTAVIEALGFVMNPVYYCFLLQIFHRVIIQLLLIVVYVFDVHKNSPSEIRNSSSHFVLCSVYDSGG